jgi:hypothetical protein
VEHCFSSAVPAVMIDRLQPLCVRLVAFQV